jgi:hypothetical protein
MYTTPYWAGFKSFRLERLSESSEVVFEVFIKAGAMSMLPHPSEMLPAFTGRMYEMPTIEQIVGG